MSNISGLVPYINLSKTAKLYGGPESFICTLRSSEYALGFSSGSSYGFATGLITGCAATGLVVGVVFGARYIYKRYKAYKECEEFIQ